MGSSTMVFHSPQVSQRPAHFGAIAPQDWQTNRATGFGMTLWDHQQRKPKSLQ